MTGRTRTRQEGHLGSDAEGASNAPGKESGGKKVPPIQRRRTSMDRGNKSQNPLPIGKTRTQAVWTLQGPETILKCRLLSGDTSEMEDP
jgi:hypothetical protein